MMPHLKTLTFPLVLLLTGLLVSCSRETTPSPNQATSDSATQTVPAAESSPSPSPGAADAVDPAGNAAHTPTEGSAEGHDGLAHQDHDSKHGGTFFMALDNKHHLEGTLERPGVFRVYIYDSFTQPVRREVLAQVDAKVIWGAQDGSPEIELKPNAGGSALEAQAPEAIHFPVTLTLLCRFPGAALSSRPELFTFPFSHFSHIDTTPHAHAAAQ